MEWMKHMDSRLLHMRYKMDSLNVALMFCGRNDYVRCLCAVGWPHIRKVFKFFSVVLFQKGITDRLPALL